MRLRPESSTRDLISAALLAAMVAVAVAAYWPGTTGDFLFDDWVNLPLLGRYGGVQDWDGLLLYLTSGIADPTGRPLSQLSFLLDARDWPADPWPFKRTNVLLHAANGALLYAVLSALGRRLPVDPRTARFAALLAAGAWLLHPLWVSTVLYVIQRQAMLAACFVLLGIRAWIAARDALECGNNTRAWGLAIVAVPVCGLLAGLSKANGLLLPVLLLALEASVLQPGSPLSGQARANRRTMVVVLLALPALALSVLLVLQATDAESSHRAWTTGQRLLTQPRALFDYLHRLLVPGLDATGLFADGFAISRDWRTPATTLPALLGLAALAIAAWCGRRRWPAFSAAVLFFLAGHLMESGILPLELYFEHRNYLPAMLLAWPAALWLAAPGAYRRWRLVAAAGFIAICALSTGAQARLWGDPEALARAWADQLPASARAQANAASYDAAAGRHQAVLDRLEPLQRARPDELQFALAALDARCALDRVTPAALAAAEHALRVHALGSDLAYRWLVSALGPGRRGACSVLPDAVLLRLMQAALTIDDDGSRRAETTARQARLRALFALRTGDCPTAVRWFDARLTAQRRPEFAQEQVGLLATWCDARTALTHLRRYRADHASEQPASTPILQLRDHIMAREGIWTHEFARLERVLEAETTPRKTGPQG